LVIDAVDGDYHSVDDDDVTAVELTSALTARMMSESDDSQLSAGS